MQKALKLFEGVRLKDKVIIIVTLGLITDVPVLIQAAEPKHFRHESHHLPQGVRILQYGVVDNIFQDAVHILESPVQGRGQGFDTVGIAALFTVIILKKQIPVQDELLVYQRLLLILAIAVIYLIRAEDKSIMKLGIVVEACDIQIIVIQARCHILGRQVRDKIEERQAEIGFADRILTIDDGLPDQVIDDALRIELIVTDIRKIKCDRILKILKAADLK